MLKQFPTLLLIIWMKTNFHPSSGLYMYKKTLVYSWSPVATRKIHSSLVFRQLMTNFPASSAQHGLGHHLFPDTQYWDNMSLLLKCVSNFCSDFNEPELTTSLLKSKFITLEVDGLSFLLLYPRIWSCYVLL